LTASVVFLFSKMPFIKFRLDYSELSPFLLIFCLVLALAFRSGLGRVGLQHVDCIYYKSNNSIVTDGALLGFRAFGAGVLVLMLPFIAVPWLFVLWLGWIAAFGIFLIVISAFVGIECLACAVHLMNALNKKSIQ